MKILKSSILLPYSYFFRTISDQITTASTAVSTKIKNGVADTKIESTCILHDDVYAYTQSHTSSLTNANCMIPATNTRTLTKTTVVNKKNCKLLHIYTML